jgi:hypothetical protein
MLTRNLVDKILVDWQNGIAGEPNNCPVAVALKSAKLIPEYAGVQTDNIVLGGGELLKIGEKLKEQIMLFDKEWFNYDSDDIYSKGDPPYFGTSWICVKDGVVELVEG